MIAILIKDMKQVIREPFLILFSLVPILASLALRVLLPLIDPFIPFVDMMHYNFIMTPFIVIFVGMMFGAIIGFILLDERDENTLIAMFVTPYGRLGYFMTKGIISSLMTLIYSLILVVLLSFQVPSIKVILTTALIVSLEAPISALVLVTLSKNKVEGLAIMKLYSVFVLLPALKYFIPGTFESFFMWIPFYWPIKIFEAGQVGTSILLPFIGGILVHLFYLVLLTKRFENSVV